MALIDIDALLAPISDEQPSGDNQEYGVVGELERMALGKPGGLDPETREIVGGEEPDWRKVRDLAISSFSQTKDLRAAIILTRALLALNGLAGLGAGVDLIARMCETYWDTVYPQLDASEGNDPVDRLNALANLDDPENILRSLRNTRILESREVGNYTLRDLEMAAGRLPVPEGSAAPNPAHMAAAWRTGTPESNADRRTGTEQALAGANGLVKLFRDRTNDEPNIDNLRAGLKRLKEYYDGVADDGKGDSEGDGDGDDAGGSGAGGGAGTGGGGKAGGALASRDDAVRMLNQIAVFLRKTEPSSPAPMFIDRAVKMLQSDFATIVKELMPDSRERIEMLGGIKLEPDESGSES